MGGGNVANQSGGQDTGPPKISPVEYYKKMKRDNQSRQVQENQTEGVAVVTEHKFASTFKVPDVYSFDFGY